MPDKFPLSLNKYFPVQLPLNGFKPDVYFGLILELYFGFKSEVYLGLMLEVYFGFKSDEYLGFMFELYFGLILELYFGLILELYFGLMLELYFGFWSVGIFCPMTFTEIKNAARSISIFFILMLLFFSMTHNGFGLGEGGDFHHKC